VIDRPKRSLGQHFLHDENIACKITASLSGYGNYRNVLEVGPGKGVLSKHLLKIPGLKWYGIEFDKQLVDYLVAQFPSAANRIKYGDFLSYDFQSLFNNEKYGLIGNFPYNISSQILLKAIENRDQIPEIVGMFQKEVAQRISSKHGNKTYGILSVLCQAFYDVEILFHVSEKVFYPPPKVTSTVIRMRIKDDAPDLKDEKIFFETVKKAFNLRRKTLRNALKQYLSGVDMNAALFDKRAEQLSVDDFVSLTRYVVQSKNAASK